MPRFEDYTPLEAAQFAFVRIPYILFTDETFKPLSVDAKLLYGLMLDRLSLSLKNGWVTDDGKPFIYFVKKDVMEVLSCASEKAVATVKALEEFGLIEKRSQGVGKPTIIIVKNFVRQASEEPEEPSSEGKHTVFENPTSRVQKSNRNQTKYNQNIYNTSSPAVTERKETGETAENCEGFDDFWKAYPRKVGKKAAKTAWLKAVKSGVSPEVILNALMKQKESGIWRETRYTPHPATWLNQGRWDDEVPGDGQPSRDTVPSVPADVVPPRREMTKEETERSRKAGASARERKLRELGLLGGNIT